MSPVYSPGFPPSNRTYSFGVIATIANQKSGQVVLAGRSTQQYVYPSQAPPGKLRISSTKRNTGSDWHYYGMACDISAAMTTQGQRLMQAQARFWLRHSSYLLELIHTSPFSDDNGFYVKNGRVVSGSYYGAATVAAHVNHVHVAMSYQAAQELLAKLKAGTIRAIGEEVPAEDAPDEGDSGITDTEWDRLEAEEQAARG